MKTGDRMSKQIRKVPIKNYVIVGLISVITFLLLGYFVFWYKNNLEYQNNNSIMSGYLSEIQEDGVIENLTSYLIDNPNMLLYMSYGNDASVKDFENEFKKLIDEHNISSNFLYIDLNSITDKNFVSKLKDSFFSQSLNNKNIDLHKQSNIFLFESGQIEDVLYNSKEKINLIDVKIFLMKHGVIEND